MIADINAFDNSFEQTYGQRFMHKNTSVFEFVYPLTAKKRMTANAISEQMHGYAALGSRHQSF